MIEWAKNHISKAGIFIYNTNIDAVKHISGSIIESVSLPKELKGLLTCMIRGKQKEVKIKEETADFILKKIGYDDIRVGGQAGNMGNTAAKLGVKAFVHVANICTEQVRLLEKNTFVAYKHGFIPSKKLKLLGRASIHFILEFKKGDKIYGKRIPNSNRFIASYDPYNFKMVIDPVFKHNSLRIIKKVNKVMMGGFHLLDEKIAREKIEEVREGLFEWKKLNNKLKIHLEFGEFQSSKVLKLVLQRILPFCSSIGFNDTELMEISKILNLKGNVFDVCKKLIKKTETLVFHTSNYSFALSKKIKEKELFNSLWFGSLVAAYKAKTGFPPSFKELKNFKCRINEKGVKELKEFEKILFPCHKAFFPSFLVENPKITVGLGDSFAAGYFLTLP